MSNTDKEQLALFWLRSWLTDINGVPPLDRQTNREGKSGVGTVFKNIH